ncbi:hypothetical protein [Aeoliella sp.]|uniref:hypothetical protein n=1 Tax=Aeoliella sp. TaxID=2795800 RepID=UPI003CCC3EA9
MFVHPSILIGLFLSLFVATTAPVAAADEPFDFIRHEGGKLYDHQGEFRFVSWNIPNLLVIEDAFEFLGDAPWRWPDKFELTDALESVRQMGGTVVRPYVITVRRDDGDMGQHVHVLAPGKFNEEAFRTLDLALAIAREKQVRLIIPLVDNWRWQGGIEQYAAFRGKQPKEFWTDPQLFDDYSQTVRYIINRRNTVTGVLYRDDPTILGWETGNELDAPPEWTAKTAALIKSLDPNHLVIDGRSLHGIPHASLDDPNIDVVTTHHYPNVGNNNAASVIAATREVAGKKAYFVGEFGFVGVEESQRMLDAVAEHSVSGALYWSLRFHRRDGGFYWHHEPSGGDLFKAYHWPGFASGEPYREHLVLPMIRNAAFGIRGQEPPPIAAPNAPQLLPIDDAARISWQGAAGASGYDIQRAESASGEWQTIAHNVSDAAVQYRPLFNDTSAIPGNSYWYRVIARNASGTSPPSNVVGPVPVNCKTLVDEFADASQAARIDGEHTFCSNDARKVQEDIHRLRLVPGSTVEYELSGDIEQVRLLLFSAVPTATPNIVAVDASGSSAELKLDIQRGRAEAGDYGYLTPVLVTAADMPAGTRRIRISCPDEVQLSRIEIRYSAR